MKNVFIVDSNEDFRESLYVALSGFIPQAQFWQIANGLNAVQKARELNPKIVLIDISLPSLSGLKVTEAVKASKNTSCVAIVIGSCLPEYLDAAKQSGVDYFLPKNRIRLADIVGLVRDLLYCENSVAKKWQQYRVI